MDATIFGILLFAVMTPLVIWRWKYDTAKQNEIEERERKIKSDYEAALKGIDKAEALRLGRIYYGSLREDGRVSTYDEQAINNDMNSMANTVNVVNAVIHKVENEDAKINISATNLKVIFCSKCGKEYVPNENKMFCEVCGNRY